MMIEVLGVHGVSAAPASEASGGRAYCGGEYTTLSVSYERP